MAPMYGDDLRVVLERARRTTMRHELADRRRAQHLAWSGQMRDRVAARHGRFRELDATAHEERKRIAELAFEPNLVTTLERARVQMGEDPLQFDGWKLAEERDPCCQFLRIHGEMRNVF